MYIPDSWKEHLFSYYDATKVKFSAAQVNYFSNIGEFLHCAIVIHSHPCDNQLAG